jgi:hypothetical protein
MCGEQGLLNFVLNQKVQLRQLQIGRLPLMVWPGRGMQGVTAAKIGDGIAPSCIVHWAGMKHSMHRNMVGSDLLDFFEGIYYERISAGKIRIVYDQMHDVLCNHWYYAIRQWSKLFISYKIQPLIHKLKSIRSVLIP